LCGKGEGESITGVAPAIVLEMIISLCIRRCVGILHLNVVDGSPGTASEVAVPFRFFSREKRPTPSLPLKVDVDAMRMLVRIKSTRMYETNET